MRSTAILLLFVARVLGSGGQDVKDVKNSAKKGAFQQAWAQCRALLAATPSPDDLSTLRGLFSKYPQIQESGIGTTDTLIVAARTEADLLRAQAEVLQFAKCVEFNVCDAAALRRLQSRFTDAVSKLVLDTGIPVTFDSDLLADWTASTGSELDKEVERRIYRNSMANIAARDPRNTPPILMTERLFRYLLREPDARKEAFDTLRKVEWRDMDFDGALREVYPDLVEEREKRLLLAHQLITGHEDPCQPPGSDASFHFDTKGIELGPWVRGFIAKIRRNWFVPYAVMSFRGHTVLTFNVHKDGTISDIAVTGPSAVDQFNTSAFKAVAASSPTEPLPSEYPAEKAFFTVTFYYNECPPSVPR